MGEMSFAQEPVPRVKSWLYTCICYLILLLTLHRNQGALSDFDVKFQIYQKPVPYPALAGRSDFTGRLVWQIEPPSQSTIYFYGM
jgi:hypothetical protein